MTTWFCCFGQGRILEKVAYLMVARKQREGEMRALDSQHLPQALSLGTWHHPTRPILSMTLNLPESLEQQQTMIFNKVPSLKQPRSKPQRTI